jgi:hypothetical protein
MQITRKIQETRRINSLVLLNYICMCIKPSTTIQTQLASSVSSNSSLLLSNYLETVIRALHGVIGGNGSSLVWGESDAVYVKNLCKAVVLVDGSEGLVNSIPLLVEVLDYLIVMLLNVGLDTYRELLLTEGEKEVAEVETCLACAGEIRFTDVTDAICANGHAWSMF